MASSAGVEIAVPGLTLPGPLPPEDRAMMPVGPRTEARGPTGIGVIYMDPVQPWKPPLKAAVIQVLISFSGIGQLAEL
ncbi:hypothetical protein J7E97_10840 [Streptomyces sp. ISL-66]|uniref:hypothetical protein n=1 Tax=Streptomyces sp. ISL-66 TaxID=2819186 RepID=UPI001BE7A998|nr:hypothetical protein [Streptomyces sp. ISL-66]MBT2468361.1 hypothetical protein [Streptomyces sp. ISL-66]